jgi:hypothetical protein
MTHRYCSCKSRRFRANRIDEFWRRIVGVDLTVTRGEFVELFAISHVAPRPGALLTTRSRAVAMQELKDAREAFDLLIVGGTEPQR